MFDHADLLLYWFTERPEALCSKTSSDPAVLATDSSDSLEVGLCNALDILAGTVEDIFYMGRVEL